jgi:hypothetical protein
MYGFSLGLSWFWPQAPPAMKGLVHELGLNAFLQKIDDDAQREFLSELRQPRSRPTSAAVVLPRTTGMGGTAAESRTNTGMLHVGVTSSNSTERTVS